MKKSWRVTFLMMASAIVLAAGQTATAATWRHRWNTAPTISGSAPTAVKAGSAYSFTPTASDAQRNLLTFSITNKPVWASFNTGNGNLSGTPGATQVGTYSNIVIRVSDGSLSAALPAFSIAVSAPTSTPTNTPPVISGTPVTAVEAGKAYSFVPKASDANGDALAFSISGKPAWASFNAATGALTGTPTTAQVGTYSNVAISVSDGKASATLPAFSIAVSAPTSTPTNTPPVISGTPVTAVDAGKAYSFVPKASDANSDALAFSVSGKPSWASFSTATGALTGTPTTTQVGTYSNVAISVSDGKASTALPAFSITVRQPVVTGSAALSWTPPTKNTDGSALTDLAGFKVYHGTSASTMTDVVQLSGGSVTSYTYSQLAAGTHYFAVSAYTNSGMESTKSAVGSKTIQ